MDQALALRSTVASPILLPVHRSVLDSVIEAGCAALLGTALAAIPCALFVPFVDMARFAVFMTGVAAALTVLVGALVLCERQRRRTITLLAVGAIASVVATFLLGWAEGMAALGPLGAWGKMLAMVARRLSSPTMILGTVLAPLIPFTLLAATRAGGAQGEGEPWPLLVQVLGSSAGAALGFVLWGRLVDPAALANAGAVLPLILLAFAALPIGLGLGAQATKRPV